MPIVNTPSERMKPYNVPGYYWDASAWVGENYQELHRLHPDHWIAVYQGEVVASSPDLGAVCDIAEARTGVQDFYVEFIEGKMRFYEISSPVAHSC